MSLIGGVLRIVNNFVHGFRVIEVVFLWEMEGRRGGGVDCVVSGIHRGGFVVGSTRSLECRMRERVRQEFIELACLSIFEK